MHPERPPGRWTEERRRSEARRTTSLAKVLVALLVEAGRDAQITPVPLLIATAIALGQLVGAIGKRSSYPPALLANWIARVVEREAQLASVQVCAPR